MALKNDCFALPQGVTWTPVEEALERLADRLDTVTDIETVPLGAGAGRILAQDVHARISAPPHANAAVDGYALAHASLSETGEQRLHLIVGRAAAGAPWPHPVPHGHALRTLTGAVMPEGTDSVVMEEDVEIDGGAIRFGSGLRAGANRRKPGEDLAAGDLALEAGTRLAPQHLAQAAAVGVADLPVRKRLRVALFSSGDELRAPGESLAPGQIFDANAPMLLAMLEALGAECIAVERLPDDAGTVRKALAQAGERADAVIATGGASAGDEDHISRELRGMGAMALWRIAMKPGRPLALGQIGQVPVFGLPGNPVAAFVCFLLFVRPALLRLAGAGWSTPKRYPLTARFSAKKKPGRSEFFRGRADGTGGVEKFASDGSGLIHGLCWSDGLIALEHARGPVAEGERVPFIPYATLGLPG